MIAFMIGGHLDPNTFRPILAIHTSVDNTGAMQSLLARVWPR